MLSLETLDQQEWSVSKRGMGAAVDTHNVAKRKLISDARKHSTSYILLAIGKEKHVGC